MAVAFVVISCKSNLSEAEKLNLDEIPIQVVEDMFYVKTENGVLKMRVETPLMEVYDHDTASFDLYPKGLKVFAYQEDGRLETTIVAEKGRHDKNNRQGSEQWSAFGNVVIRNIINQETMETDTIYWDSKNHEIWTDCYVKMYSPSGFMQGTGMRSDEMARNAILHHPFDNEFLLQRDSTEVQVDSINFIGPVMKK